MTQAGAKGPAAPLRAPPPPAKAASPAAPPVVPKPPQSAPSVGNPPRAPAQSSPALGTAPLAPKKGPPPIPPDSAPEMGTRALEPMRQRYETSPGMGQGFASSTSAAESPRAPGVLSREDVEAMIRKAVADAVVTVLGETRGLMNALERRLDDLERRPAPAVAPAPPMVGQAAPPPYATRAAPSPFVAPAGPPPGAAPAGAVRVAQPVAQPTAQPLVRTQALAYVSAIPVSVLPIPVSLSPVLDLKAIERDVHIEVDSALDGSKRKRRIVIFVVLFILVVFGGMFALLADSYAPHH